MRGDVITGKYFMNGDTAAAEGALAAGCRFFAGYPITPSTEIAERMAERLPEIGGVYIQMEDELGSMAAILGASCAGVKAMSATSGPGFSLMMENIGLGIMLEVPAVVVNVQRGGPSTGLPTTVGQQDMMQAKWGSHGDYEIIAYCPNSPQEMFDLTVKAFNAAERYRLPVLVMADEAVGHMTERVVIPEKAAIPIVHRKTPTVPPSEYKTFAPDKDLIPAFAVAGQGYFVRMESLTHDELGRPSLTAETQAVLVQRLQDKILTHAHEIAEYEEYLVDDADIVVVAYGITSRTVRQAVDDARKEGIRAGLLRLITAWPFPSWRIEELAAHVKAFVVPEVNFGQMVHEVERAAGSRVPTIFVKYTPGALPHPDRTLKALREVAK
jgi:2-oxoglutarate ferredoxin oxidoreductase subunit alpha